jgi:hypothetical protein
MPGEANATRGLSRVSFYIDAHHRPISMGKKFEGVSPHGFREYYEYLGAICRSETNIFSIIYSSRIFL